MTDFGKTTSQRLTEAEPGRAIAEKRKTGWPPGMLQDESKAFSEALARDPMARQHVRDVARQIKTEQCIRCPNADYEPCNYPMCHCHTPPHIEDQSQSADREAWPIIAALVLTAVAIGSMVYSCAEYLPV